MALLTCPECGANVSDKAANCPHCGAPIQASAQQQIPVPPQQPIVQQPEQPPVPQQPWQLHPQPQGHSTASIILIVLAIVLGLALVGGIAYYMFSDKKESRNYEEEERIEVLEKEKKELSKQLEEEKTKKAFEEGKAAGAAATAKKQSTTVVTVPAGTGTPKVVINGTGVRFRFAPSLDSGYLTWSNGQTRSVAKGTRLTYAGETDGWYKVSYLGHIFYVSKDFSYLGY